MTQNEQPKFAVKGAQLKRAPDAHDTEGVLTSADEREVEKAWKVLIAKHVGSSGQMGLRHGAIFHEGWKAALAARRPRVQGSEAVAWVDLPTGVTSRVARKAYKHFEKLAEFPLFNFCHA